MLKVDLSKLLSVSLATITGAAVSTAGQSDLSLLIHSMIGGIIAAVSGYFAVEIVKKLGKKGVMKSLIQNIWKAPKTTVLGALIVVVGFVLYFVPESTPHAKELLYFGVALIVGGPTLFFVPDKKNKEGGGSKRKLYSIIVLALITTFGFSCKNKKAIIRTVIETDSVLTTHYKDTIIYTPPDSASKVVDYKAIMKELHDLKSQSKEPKIIYQKSSDNSLQLRFKLDSINNLVAEIYKLEDSLMLKNKTQKVEKITTITKEVPLIKKTPSNGRSDVSPANLDGVAAMVITGPEPTTPTGHLTHGVEETFFSLEDAEAKGIDSAYDTANTVLVWRHLKDFYDLAGAGAELHFMLAPQTVSGPADVLQADIVNKDNDYLAKMVKDNEGRIRLAAVALNPDSGYTPTITDEIDADVAAAITNAKALIADAASKLRYLSVIFEGRSFSGTHATLKDLRAADGPNANRVSVMLGSDPSIADDDAAFAPYASVGLLLGRLAADPVNRAPGRVKSGTVLEQTSFGLSGGNALATYSDVSLQTIDAKGFVFLRKFSGKNGFYFNDDHVAAPITDDYPYIVDGRVIDKVSRIAYEVYLDEVRDDVEANPDGTLPIVVLKNLESLMETEIIKQMQSKQELSSVSVNIPTDQDVVANGFVSIDVQATVRNINRLFKITVGKPIQ